MFGSAIAAWRETGVVGEELVTAERSKWKTEGRRGSSRVLGCFCSPNASHARSADFFLWTKVGVPRMCCV